MIRGYLRDGVGRGAAFVHMGVYSFIFEKYLKGIPFPGTLNVELDDTVLIEEVFEKADIFDNLEFGGKKMGGIKVARFTLHFNDSSMKVVGVRPLLTSHKSNIVELVSEYNLRQYWGLNTDDVLHLTI